MSIASCMLHHGYKFRELIGGSVSCRKITGSSSKTSGHAHGCCLDFNPSKNGYRVQAGPIQWGRHTDMSKEMIRDIEAVRTTGGSRATQWGGRWTNIKDAMHFQPYVTDVQSIRPTTVAGWSDYTVWLAHGPQPIPEEDMALLPIQYGHGYSDPPDDSGLVGDMSFKKEDVRHIQLLAGISGSAVDGVYGHGTAAKIASSLVNEAEPEVLVVDARIYQDLLDLRQVPPDLSSYAKRTWVKARFAEVDHPHTIT